MNRLALAISSLFLLASPAFPNGSETFRAKGNEPFWSLSMTDSELSLQSIEGSPATVTPVLSARQDGNAEIYEAKPGGESLVLTITSKVCNDTMSGMPFPKSVTVALGTQILKGCGGEPATLLHGAWLITEINGKPIIAGSSPGLAFDSDGKVNGNGSCNRFFGGYQLSGEALTVGNVGASMMMCDEATMNQEGQIFKLLKELTGFGISEDGQLILRTSDERTMTARPDR